MTRFTEQLYALLAENGWRPELQGNRQMHTHEGECPTPVSTLDAVEIQLAVDELTPA